MLPLVVESMFLFCFFRYFLPIIFNINIHLFELKICFCSKSKLFPTILQCFFSSSFPSHLSKWTVIRKISSIFHMIYLKSAELKRWIFIDILFFEKKNMFFHGMYGLFLRINVHHGLLVDKCKLLCALQCWVSCYIVQQCGCVYFCTHAQLSCYSVQRLWNHLLTRENK